MMFIRRLLLRRKLRKEIKTESIYTIFAFNNEFGQAINAPLFRTIK